MSVATMIDKVFYAMGDSSRLKSNPVEVLFALNYANREFRKELLRVKPSLLYETETLNTVIGTKEYTLTNQPLRVAQVRYAGRLINAIKQEDVPDTMTTGTPVARYMSSPTKICLYPIPIAVAVVSVIAVRTAITWTDASVSGWVEEVEDGLVNYAAAKILGTELPSLPITLVVGMIEDIPAAVVDGYDEGGCGYAGIRDYH